MSKPQQVRQSGSWRFTYQPRNCHSGVHITQVARHSPGMWRKSVFQRSQEPATSSHSPGPQGFGCAASTGRDIRVSVPAGRKSATRSDESSTTTIGLTSQITGEPIVPLSSTCGPR